MYTYVVYVEMFDINIDISRTSITFAKSLSDVKVEHYSITDIDIHLTDNS